MNGVFADICVYVSMPAISPGRFRRVGPADAGRSVGAQAWKRDRGEGERSQPPRSPNAGRGTIMWPHKTEQHGKSGGDSATRCNETVIAASTGFSALMDARSVQWCGQKARC